MLTAAQCYSIFNKSIADYHQHDHVDAALTNPFPGGSFEALLYHKNWIDTVQWHLEDIIRLPDINPSEALQIKRRIDKSNQERTDMVEKIDDYFLNALNHVIAQPGARINSETPAWLLDRMSILMLKIFHMDEQVKRADADDAHRAKCNSKLAVLTEQKADMQTAFDELIEDISKGIQANENV